MMNDLNPLEQQEVDNCLKRLRQLLIRKNDEVESNPATEMNKLIYPKAEEIFGIPDDGQKSLDSIAKSLEVLAAAHQK